MSAPRFFCPSNLALGAIVNLPDTSAHHAARVLRMKEGDETVLFNGDGNNYRGAIIRISKSEVVVKVDSQQKVERESPLAITLAQAISSGDRMDYTLQKAVELGINAIQPIAAERSVVKLAGDRADKRREHWQNVVVSACEQCGRAVVPVVAPILSLTDWLGKNHSYDLKLMLAPDAEHTLHTLQKPDASICLLIGCEGGLSPQEQAAAASCGFVSTRLGPRVLRTETAAVAALSAIQTLWGDF